MTPYHSEPEKRVGDTSTDNSLKAAAASGANLASSQSHSDSEKEEKDSVSAKGGRKWASGWRRGREKGEVDEENTDESERERKDRDRDTDTEEKFVTNSEGREDMVIRDKKAKRKSFHFDNSNREKLDDFNERNTLLNNLMVSDKTSSKRSDQQDESSPLTLDQILERLKAWKEKEKIPDNLDEMEHSQLKKEKQFLKKELRRADPAFKEKIRRLSCEHVNVILHSSLPLLQNIMNDSYFQ